MVAILVWVAMVLVIGAVVVVVQRRKRPSSTDAAIRGFQAGTVSRAQSVEAAQLTAQDASRHNGGPGGSF